MSATPVDLDFGADDLRMAADLAIRRGSGDAVPVFNSDPAYPRIWNINDLRDRPEAKWLISNIVEDRGLTIFFGPDKVGKTAVLSNFLWAWAGDKDHFLTSEFRMTGEERRVLYVLLEGQANFYSRYDAWCSAYNDGEPVEDFYVMDEGLSLFQSRMEWEDPSTWTPSARKLWNAVDSLRPGILVIDTLSRATAGMDENSSSMAHVVGMLDHMRDVFGVATIIVHHTSLADGDRPRGHSSLKGAASSYARIEGKPEAEVLYLKTGPHRNSDEYQAVPFRRVHEKASFVVRGTVAPSDGRKQDKLWELVMGADGRLSADQACRAIYGDDSAKSRKRLLSLVRNHPNLEYDAGRIVVLERDEVERL